MIENWVYLHNEAMSLAASACVFGLAAYAFIFAAPIVGLLRSPRDSQFIARAYSVLIVTGGLMAGGLTEVLFKYELPTTFLFFMVPAFLFYCRDNRQERS